MVQEMKEAKANVTITDKGSHAERKERLAEPLKRFAKETRNEQTKKD